MKINPVILSGGSGTRLWPVSRQLNPKQFVDFFGKVSLFQRTALRVQNSKHFSEPVVVCNDEHRFIAAEELRKINLRAQSIILEPFGRNTASAIAVAALDVISKNKENDLLLVMPSDHLIDDEESFIEQVKKAAIAAEKGFLITFGIKPQRPETGYGYIKKLPPANDLQSSSELFFVEKFVEKPQKQVAEKFLLSDDYLWNSGIFMFRASTYLEILQAVNNEILTCCSEAYAKAVSDLDFIRIDAEEFAKCPNISIDYAVMEKIDASAKRILVMPIDVDWSDVGSWQTIADLSEKDENQNSLIGDSFALKSKNCYINSQDKLTAAIGVENLIILALKDAVLVLNKNNAQDVKEMFEILKKLKREECSNHTKILRPWGSFETVDFDSRFKVKRITVNPKSSLSLQMHKHRAEHWVVVKGKAFVTCAERQFELSEDQSTYIPLSTKHRLENKEDSPLELIEVQTGSYLGEDDIVRFSDFYGRST